MYRLTSLSFLMVYHAVTSINQSSLPDIFVRINLSIFFILHEIDLNETHEVEKSKRGYNNVTFLRSMYRIERYFIIHGSNA